MPPHIHDAHDDYFYILDGQLTLWAGDAEVVADAGAVVAAPRGVPHGYRNDTEQPCAMPCLVWMSSCLTAKPQPASVAKT